MTAQTPVTPEISLVEAVWRYRLMSLIIVLACLLASVAATQILFSGATATARFAVTDPTNNNNALRMGVISGQGYATYTAQRAAFAGSTPVMARAAQIVRDKRGPKLTGEQLRGRVKTSSKPDGGVVIVTASGANMTEAAVIANSVLQAYQDVTISTNTGKLDEQIKSIKALQTKVTQDMEVTQSGSRAYRLLANQLTKLQGEESGLLSARSKTNDGVQFLDTADPSAPMPSKLPQNAAIGFAIGVILACVVSFLRASARPRRPVGPGPLPAGGPAGGPPEGLGGAAGGAPVGALGSGQLTGGAPELPAGRSYQGRRHASDVRVGGARPEDSREPLRERPEQGEREDPLAPASGRGRQPRRGRSATPAAPRPASATQAVPAAPPPLPPERDRGRPRLNGSSPASSSSSPGSGLPVTPASGSGSGSRGSRGSGNGSAALGKAPRGKGGRGKPRGETPAEPEGGTGTDVPADLWADGGDPTRTAEDPASLLGGKGSLGSTPSGSSDSGTPDSGNGSGKGKGDTSLMHYDLDR
ncbi:MULTISPECIES: hypothetical protein [Actinomadura]|uniref:Polysaccharide chain length determinant N-terminal domain-containing protein n=1 Tax=Actinomadura litoris TaxID=2678616 RepID=A0A7K1L6Z6_9ACTN|nr:MULTISPECIES: hypothetical protein [Actinomadura]MBT2213874.1 hypothetical protein [Actinomadura sp. NEAU-AAG7]MUN39965.1 hypothetical protein [Actinomadura litoris]